MGLLDDLLWNVGPDLPAFSGRRARRVPREGEACNAEVVGIEVEQSTSRTVEPEYRYALDVRSAAGVSRVGVPQRLTPRYDAHLGAVVPVHVRGKRVVIDWAAGATATSRSWAPGGWSTRRCATPQIRQIQPQPILDRTQEVGGSSPPSSTCPKPLHVRGFRRLGNAVDRPRSRSVSGTSA